MSRHSKKRGIPDRWLDYKAVGKRLRGTRFIAFKVPLKQSLNRQLSQAAVFGPWELLDTLKKENQELGLIIDLTFTTRYYKLQDLPESMLFVKIFTAGHEIPKDNTILSFKRAVGSFLRDNADNDKLIGVHCTHGLNRTGYLICRYLIDVDGMNPKEAVELFNSSRGHNIERQNYLQDLLYGPKRSNTGMDQPEQEPQRGCAVHQPAHCAPMSDSRDERRLHYDDSRYHRSFPPHSQYRPPYDSRLPNPPVLRPPPILCAPMVHTKPTPLYPNRWTAPHPDTQWDRPSRSAETRSRFPPRPTSQHQRDTRRGPLLPPPLPRYSPAWTDHTNDYHRPEEQWTSARRRHHYRHTNME
ncbi:RNA/RNP complex-1-interacting phosphatase [Channa argus]|uniref:RNA/RNP complex-1-interacting phosphatase n=1 Tax=Channa argus TaxID=215402 RepID=A0A6G1QH57_CHAAH|nr:RNA/RNP complex-1-interacting phosphatase [Channa argus]